MCTTRLRLLRQQYPSGSRTGDLPIASPTWRHSHKCNGCTTTFYDDDNYDEDDLQERWSAAGSDPPIFQGHTDTRWTQP